MTENNGIADFITTIKGVFDSPRMELEDYSRVALLNLHKDKWE